MVKMSTGDVYALGLVVSCFKRSCEMLHVTESRTVVVIVFGMCTATVVLSLFIMQAFCLALYNASCKLKNVGTGFSYLSFLIAFSLGATLALYQIDLTEERKPDVTSMKIGWSRFSVIGSSGAFLLGALLNIADYVRRNRIHRREIQKKFEVRNKMIAALEKSKKSLQAKAIPGAFGPVQPSTSGGGGGNFKGKRMSMTVDAAVTMAKAKKGLESSLNTCKNPNTGAPGSKANVILVNEASSKTNTVNNSGVKGSGMQQRQQQDKPRPHAYVAGGGTLAAVEALKKNRLTKSGHVDSVDGRQVLPSVEEEKDNHHDGKTDDQRRRDNYNSSGQVTKPRISDNSRSHVPIGSLADTKDGDRRRYLSDKPARMDSEGIDPSSKYVVSSQTQGRHNNHVPAEDNKPDTSRRRTETDTKLMDVPSEGQRSRRGSAVEDAILSVSHFLDQNQKLGVSPRDPASSLDRKPSDSKYDRVTADNSLLPQQSRDFLGDKKELPPITKRRGLVTEDSLDIQRNSLRHSLSVDSDKDKMSVASKEDPPRYRTISKDYDDMDGDTSLRADTKSEFKRENVRTGQGQVTEQLSEEQIKRNQILENMSRNRERKKKRITQ